MLKYPMNFSQFDTFFFDAGNTLLYPYPSAAAIYGEIAAKHNNPIKTEIIAKSFHSAWEKRDQETYSNQERYSIAWWEQLVKATFEPFTPFKNFDIFFRDLYTTFYSAKRWRLYPETIEVLQKLKKQNKKLFIVSNWSSDLRGILDKKDITKYFEEIIISAELKSTKPDKIIFQQAINASNTNIKKIIHIGDNYDEDIIGGNSVELQTALLLRNKTLQKGKYPKANYLIKSLTEII